jgi:hypothetical protein
VVHMLRNNHNKDRKLKKMPGKGVAGVVGSGLSMVLRVGRKRNLTSSEPMDCLFSAVWCDKARNIHPCIVV